MSVKKRILAGAALIGVAFVVGAMALGGRAIAATPAGDARFSNYIDDLPVMPGLTETEDGYAFDISQGGRMAEARLAGSADARVVRSFYAATLPQLGWTPVGPEVYIYKRGRERMIFRVEQKRSGRGPDLLAIFVITPETPTAPQDRRR